MEYGGSSGGLVEERVECRDAVAANDDDVEPGDSLRVFGRPETPGQTAGVSQRLGRADLVEYVAGQELMQGCDRSIERVAANMTLVRIGEHDVFDKEFLDRGATLRGGTRLFGERSATLGMTSP